MSRQFCLPVSELGLETKLDQVVLVSVVIVFISLVARPQLHHPVVDALQAAQPDKHVVLVRVGPLLDEVAARGNPRGIGEHRRFAPNAEFPRAYPVSSL